MCELRQVLLGHGIWMGKRGWRQQQQLAWPRARSSEKALQRMERRVRVHERKRNCGLALFFCDTPRRGKTWQSARRLGFPRVVGLMMGDEWWIDGRSWQIRGFIQF